MFRHLLVSLTLAALIAVALAGAACRPAVIRTEAFIPGEVIRVDLPRTTTAVNAADIAAVVTADTAFGLDLFRVTAGDENLMVSPYSIATALSMVYPGAKGVTATEIAEVLRLTVDGDTLHAVRNHIDSALVTPPPLKSSGVYAMRGIEDTRKPFTIRPANSAWGQGGYPFLDEYLAILAENYGAGLRLVDYKGDPEGSRRIINGWVEEATEDRIKELIPEEAITSDTRLTLVNAVWFKANWEEPFDAAATELGTFTLLDGTEIEVPLMHKSFQTNYASTDRFEAVRLPYAGDAAMVVLLPKQGSPAELAATLKPDDLDIEWVGKLEVEVTLPSFEFEAEIDLKSALQELGMRAAFEFPWGDGADFTGITANRELFVSDAFHKTFIATDEEGTEAAAATSFTFLLFGGVMKRVAFTADHPFLFWIEHTSTGEILFLGQVTNPSGFSGGI